MSFQATCCVCTEHGYSQQEVNSVLFCFFILFEGKVLSASLDFRGNKNASPGAPATVAGLIINVYIMKRGSSEDSSAFFSEQKEIFLFPKVFFFCFFSSSAGGVWPSQGLFLSYLLPTIVKSVYVQRDLKNKVIIMRSTVMTLQMTSALASAAVGGSTAEGPPTQWVYIYIYMYSRQGHSL